MSRDSKKKRSSDCEKTYVLGSHQRNMRKEHEQSGIRLVAECSNR